jgi:AcrR family transcriptional regulator
LYFRDKADLIAHLCEDCFAKLVQQLETIASLATNPAEGLRASMLAYAEFGLKNPAFYLVTFVLPDSMLAASSGARLVSAGIRTRVLECIRRSVDECIRQGQIRKVDAETTAQAIWAALHGVTSLLVVYPDFPWADREALIDQVIDTAVEILGD